MRQWHEMIHELIISDRTPELLCIGIQNELVCVLFGRDN